MELKPTPLPARSSTYLNHISQTAAFRCRLINIIASLTLMISTFALITPAHALPDDQQKPAVIESDSAVIEEDTGLTVYKGSVRLQQGSILIEANTLVVKSTDGNVERISARGAPVHFQFQRVVDGPLSHGYAQTMDYDLQSEKIVLRKNARFEQECNRYEADKIDYSLRNNKIEFFSESESESEKDSVDRPVVMTFDLRKKPARQNQTTSANGETKIMAADKATTTAIDCNPSRPKNLPEDTSDLGQPPAQGNDALP